MSYVFIPYTSSWYSKKFAYLPTRLDNGSRVWLKTYWTHNSELVSHIFHGIYNSYEIGLKISKLSVEEYELIQLRKKSPLDYFNKELESL